MGGLGENIHVSTGGFYVESGSDIWNGTGGLNGAMGYSLFSDQTISICHRDSILAAGESSTFEFVVSILK